MPFCKVEKDVRIYYETFGSGSPLESALQDPGPHTKQVILNIMMQWPLYAQKQMGRDAGGAKFLAGGFPNGKLVVFENRRDLFSFLNQSAAMNPASSPFINEEIAP